MKPPTPLSEIGINENDSPTLWRNAVETELQGLPFEKKLVTKTFEGIAQQPIYFAKDAVGLGHLTASAGEAPFARGARVASSQGRVWEFCQYLSEDDAEKFNEDITAGLGGGLTAICLGRPSSGITRDQAYYRAALKGVVLEAIPVHVSAGARPFPAAREYLEYALSTKARGTELSGSVTADPLLVAAEGALAGEVETSLHELAEWTSLAANVAPRVATVGISARLWLEAGGTAVQELALALSAGVETLRALDRKGVPPSISASRMRFEFAVGGQFFTEIAKFRAFRVLWARVLQAFELDPAKSWPQVGACTAEWNKSILDPHVNLLRVTTEALSAVLGGVDSLAVGCYDQLLNGGTVVSRRIARNLHTILAEEFRLSSPADPLGGSWFVEKLTDELARGAWSIFQEVEKSGGHLAAIRSGRIARMIEESAQAKREAVSKRRLSLVGVNLFPNLRDKLCDIDAPVPSAADDSSKTCAVRQHRAAEGFERIRRATEAYRTKTGQRPRVFLARMGPPKQHKARADFAAGFFAAGGFETIGKDAFASASDAAHAAVDSAAPIVVLCSTDESYASIAPQFVGELKLLNPGLTAVLAGYPAELVSQLKAGGFDEFIHVRSNVLETLEKLLTRIGVITTEK